MKKFLRIVAVAVIAAVGLGLAAPAQAFQLPSFFGAFFDSLWMDQAVEQEMEQQAREQERALKAMTAQDFGLSGGACTDPTDPACGGGGPMIIPRSNWQCTPQTPQYCCSPQNPQYCTGGGTGY